MSRYEELMSEAESRLDAALEAFESEADLEQLFGAPTSIERAELQAEKAEVERLEAEAMTKAPAESYRRKNPLWTWRRRGL